MHSSTKEWYLMDFYHRWKLANKRISIVFPCLIFAGDTMEHKKLCSLRGGSMGKFPCQMCSTTRKCLDSPLHVPMRKMT